MSNEPTHVRAGRLSKAERDDQKWLEAAARSLFRALADAEAQKKLPRTQTGK